MGMTMRQGGYRKDCFDKMKEKVEQRGEPFPKPEINYRALMERIPAVTYINMFDEARNPLYVSPQIEAMLGFSSAEWLADPGLWFRQVHPGDRMRVITEVYKSYVNGKPFRSEYRFLASDGRVVWVRDEAVVVVIKKKNFSQEFFPNSFIWKTKQWIRISIKSCCQGNRIITR
jgi:PAS domain S-box-containing protein